MRFRPVIDRRQVAVFGQFGQGQGPIVTDIRALWRVIKQIEQVRRQVISPALVKLGQQVVGPVGAVNLQAVTEYRVGRMVAKGRHQAVGNRMEMVLHGIGAHMIQHIAFATHTGTLDLLAGRGLHNQHQGAIMIGRRDGNAIGHCHRCGSFRIVTLGQESGHAMLTGA